MTRCVDHGKQAVAAAEAAAFGGTDADELVDREELHRRLSDLVGGRWWHASGPPVVIAVPRRDARSSSARVSDASLAVEIRLTDEQLTVATVAHELAHALAGVAHGHDAAFRAAYVDVTSLLAGAAPAAALTAAFAAFDLDVAVRRWPAPWLAEGDSFRLVP